MLAIRSAEEAESPEMEDMDTSEPSWCWFYLAECGVWHMFEVTCVHHPDDLHTFVKQSPAPWPLFHRSVVLRHLFTFFSMLANRSDLPVTPRSTPAQRVL